MNNELFIADKGEALVEIIFLPFEVTKILTKIGIHECTLHFIDDNCGEFFIRIEGHAISPLGGEPINWFCQANTIVEKLLRISPFNSSREKALAYFHQVNSKQGKDTVSKKAYLPRISLSKKTIKDRSRSSIVNEKDTFLLPKNGAVKYKVEYSSIYFKGPSEISLRPSDRVNEKTEINSVELPITFSPKNPGKYTCKILISAVDFPDYRTYTLVGLAKSEGSNAELELRTIFKEPVSQEIPFKNTSNDDWHIKSSVNGAFFYIPNAITVKAGQTGGFPITFKPPKHGKYTAKVTFTNLQTLQHHSYILNGISMEPEEEELIEIRCKNKELVINRLFRLNSKYQCLT